LVIKTAASHTANSKVGDLQNPEFEKKKDWDFKVEHIKRPSIR
jgi:hypothetical protein